MERQQVQPRATWQETVETDRTRTDFKDMGTMRNRTVELVRWWKTLDRLWRRRMSECWQLKFNAKTVIDMRALFSGERRGDSPIMSYLDYTRFHLHPQATRSVNCCIPVFVSVCSVLRCRCLMKALATIATAATQVYIINIFLRLHAKASCTT